ncbi:MAG TPA: glycosyltransferase family 87 protein [Chloroflexia bacterium]|nr:glycosyltransferase family 87 protein [Chloroflexia bacterium]
MTHPASGAPRPAVARPRRAGFVLRLGSGLCLGLLVAYGLLAAMQIQKAGGLEPYVRKTDFLSVLTGAAILVQGRPQQLYDEPAQAAAQAGLLRESGVTPRYLLYYNHPPFEALISALLWRWGLSAGAIFGVWTGLSLLAIIASLAALHWGWPVPGPGAPVLTLAAAAFFPLAASLLLGQNSALVLLGWAGGSAALARGYPGWAGVGFALATIKPQAMPVILLALVLGRYGRALATYLGTLALAVGLTLPILGGDWPLRYGTLLVQTAIRPADPVIDPATMQNWRGLFTQLLGPGLPALEFTIGATLLTLAGWGLVWWRGGRTPPPPGPIGSGQGAWNDLWALTLVVALLVNPHLQLHDLALALVPGWILGGAAAARADRRRALWLGVGWVLGLLALYRSLPLTVVWLAGTAGWLGWAAWRPRRGAPGARVAPGPGDPPGP